MTRCRRAIAEFRDRPNEINFDPFRHAENSRDDKPSAAYRVSYRSVRKLMRVIQRVILPPVNASVSRSACNARLSTHPPLYLFPDISGTRYSPKNFYLKSGFSFASRMRLSFYILQEKKTEFCFISLCSSMTMKILGRKTWGLFPRVFIRVTVLGRMAA